MTTWQFALTGAAASAVVAGVVVSGVRPLLRRWQIVDTPNARSSHDRPVLRGGGLGPAVALVALSGLVWVATDNHASRHLAIAIGGTVFMYAALGWYEDVRGLSVQGRAIAQVLFGLVSVALLFGALQPSAWMAVPAALGLVSFVNAANFMDGLNGLSGFFGVASGLSYAGLGLANDLPWLVVAGSCLGAAFAAFLPWNAVRPRLFLGDVGSYALGSAVGALAVAAAFAGVPVPAALAPTLIYLADTGYTLWKRVRAGERWFEAHRSHVYQRLNQGGRSHLTVALFVGGATLLTGALGILWAAGEAPVRILAGLLAVLSILGYLASPRWLAVRNATTSPLGDEGLSSTRRAT